MVYVALLFLATFCGLFAWLLAVAFRTNRLLGLGWSATKTDNPLRYWSGIAAYLLNLTIGLLFLAVLAVLGLADVR